MKQSILRPLAAAAPTPPVTFGASAAAETPSSGGKRWRSLENGSLLDRESPLEPVMRPHSVSIRPRAASFGAWVSFGVSALLLVAASACGGSGGGGGSGSGGGT